MYSILYAYTSNISEARLYKSKRKRTIENLSDGEKGKIRLYKMYKEEYLDDIYKLQDDFFNDMLQDFDDGSARSLIKKKKKSRIVHKMNLLHESLLDVIDTLYDELVGRHTPSTSTDKI